MKEVILLRFGEIFLKGKNYSFFENTLIKNIKYRLKNYKHSFENIYGRFLISNFEEDEKEKIISKLKNTFGLVSISIAIEVKNEIDKIIEACENLSLTCKTFKIETNRADKNFSLKSIEVSALIGEKILTKQRNLKVDVHNPEQIINIDIRQNGSTYIYHNKIDCLGGLPVGCSGKGLLLLSGGIDSPVAGVQMAKRGLKIDAIHFFSYPYTSEQAKQKVLTLADIIKEYTMDINLYCVPFTKIQEEIHKHCDEEYMVTLVRCFMMEIAEKVAEQNNCSCLITGENLAQVASQTVESITITNKIPKNLPIFRPLISYDKIDISKISQEIGAFETSILPYEDCCSVFLPKNPSTHPKEEKVRYNLSLLNKEELIKNAMTNIEKFSFKL